MTNTINFGIDLGTTNSLIAKFEGGSVTLFKNPVGWKETLPSVVAFRNDRILVGDKAREYLTKDSKFCAGQFKRKMGTTETYLIGPNKDAKTPIELSAQVLKELKTFVNSGEKVDAAVITVPASFDAAQCAATTEAAAQAGINNVVLLLEPIAASLAYANHLRSRGSTEGKWLVYDLGGGTFDVTLVEIADGEQKIIDHEGDNYLGGTDFDALIVEKLVLPFLEGEGFEIDFAKDMTSASGQYNRDFYSLLKRAEDAKKELSTQTSAEIEFPFEDEDWILEITRSEFEALIKEPISRTIEMVRKIMTRNSLRPSDLNFVLMVGGSTYIPYVRKLVEELVGVAVRTDVDPTTAVAVGAAYFAATKDRTQVASLTANADGASVSIKAAFNKTSRDKEELFIAKVSDFDGQLSYRIKRNDGGFDSGLLKLTERISLDLPLVPDSYNVFSFKVFDAAGDEVLSDLSEFSIAHNMFSVQGQPLTHDISLELDDVGKGTTYLRSIFRRNTPLPARSAVQSQTVTRPISKKSLGDALFINVKEGPSDYLPESVDSVGTLVIRGKQLKRDLPKGSDIEISLEISESREVKASAYIPFLDQSFEDIFTVKQREVVLETLTSDIDSLEYKIDDAIEEADSDDDVFIGSLEKMKSAVSLLGERAASLADDDTTDVKYQLERELRDIAQQLNLALKLREGDSLLDSYQEAKSSCENLVDEAGTPKDRLAFEDITSGDEAFMNPPSVAHLKANKDELWSLYWRIKWRQPSYLTGRFERLVGQVGADASKTMEALIRQGKQAIIEEDYTRLRGVLNQMFDELPSFEDVGRSKTGIG